MRPSQKNRALLVPLFIATCLLATANLCHAARQRPATLARASGRGLQATSAFSSISSSCSRNVTFSIGYSYTGIDSQQECQATSGTLGVSLGAGASSLLDMCFEWTYTVQPGGAALSCGTYPSLGSRAVLAFIDSAASRAAGKLVGDPFVRIASPGEAWPTCLTGLTTADSGSEPIPCTCGDSPSCLTFYLVDPFKPVQVTCGGSTFARVTTSCQRDVDFTIGYAFAGNDADQNCALTATATAGGQQRPACLEGVYTAEPGDSDSIGTYPALGSVANITFVKDSADNATLLVDKEAHPASSLGSTCATLGYKDCTCGQPGCYIWYQVNHSQTVYIECEGSGGGGSNIGAIVGGVVGGIVAVAALACLAFFLIRRRRQQAQAHPAASHPAWLAAQQPPPFLGKDTLMPAPMPAPTSGGGFRGDGTHAPATACSLKASSPAGAPLLPSTLSPSMSPLASSLPPAWFYGGSGSTAAADSLLPHRQKSNASALMERDGSTPPPATPSAHSAAELNAPIGSADSEALALSKDDFLSKIVSMMPPEQVARRPSVPGPVDASSWTFQWGELTVCKPIGEGSFGRVYLCKWHQIPVACKILVDKAAVQKEDSVSAAGDVLVLPKHLVARLDEEAGLLAALRHPNVVGFYGICYSPPCMLTEHCSRGSLMEVLARGRRDPGVAAQLSWRRLLSMALDASLGMLYLHTRPTPIIHRDLKSPNLLVDDNWRVKVCDFNLSRLLLEENGKSCSMAATNPRWLAPELMRGGRANKASDVFALGIVMWELLTWQLPWAEVANGWQLVNHLMQGARLAVPERTSLPCMEVPDEVSFAAYVELMQACWSEVEAARPQFRDVSAELSELLNQAHGSAGHQ